ncbi:MAG: hypothetical protein U1A23_04870 [Candidatus Sungbacteria bacterium]|nr:hypothetical protein [bacterium]MDZ4286235.1 hypothetical protein [Candidatus Sungbacteria bacterium]
MDHSHDVWVSWIKITDSRTFENMKNAAFALAQEPGRLHGRQSDNAVSYYDQVGHGIRNSSWITYPSQSLATLERRVIAWLYSGHGVFCFAFTPRSADSSAVFWYLQNRMEDEQLISCSHTIRLADILPLARDLDILIGGEATSAEAGLALKNYMTVKDGTHDIDSPPPQGLESIILDLADQEATLYPDELLLHEVPEIPDTHVYQWCEQIAHAFLTLITPLLEKENS